MARQFLSEFRLVDEEVISGYVNNLCTKSCALDPIPSSVFQRCEHRLVPVITRIVNLSLQGGQLSDRFKVGVIKPLLKKSGAEHENLSNFRPVSNIYVLSKVTEKAVAAQLCDHLNGNNEGLLEEFQSAYNDVITLLKTQLSESIITFCKLLTTTNLLFYYCFTYRLHLILSITRSWYQDSRIVSALAKLLLIGLVQIFSYVSSLLLLMVLIHH